MEMGIACADRVWLRDADCIWHNLSVCGIQWFSLSGMRTDQRGMCDTYRTLEAGSSIQHHCIFVAARTHLVLRYALYCWEK